MIAGSGELDKAGAKTQCFFDISLKLKLYIENRLRLEMNVTKVL